MFVLISGIDGTRYADSRHLVELIDNRTDCSVHWLWQGEQINAALSFETTKRLETSALVQFEPETSQIGKDRVIGLLRRCGVDRVWQYVY